ncbi:Hypothetical predicted protein [Paramuricea clavata]|uniref:Uncharacterized protein n=1 Tax=Paramuricea clavata TaxID=317549 RepID=A0A7D9JNE8_PARCT|nr:Hypothetical predicted protein [Paramuricea clavata]
MKFYCSTKKFEGKQEAHAIASKLEGAAFLCIARLDDELQDDPKEVKAALRKEFNKESIDHEKAVDELRGLRRKGGETPAQLAWRIEKLMAKAYPELCASTHGSAKKTKEQMLHDTFLGAIDNAMSRKIKSDSKHRDLNLTQLSEELDRLELIYKTTAPKVNLEVNNCKTTGKADEISLRKIIREEVAAALSKENDGSRETEDETKCTVGFVGKRNFPPKPRSGKTGGWEQSSAKINSFSAAKKFITLTGTVVQSGSREFKHEFICDSGAEISVIPTALAQEHYMKIQPTTRHVEMANGPHAECRVKDQVLNLAARQKVLGENVKFCQGQVLFGDDWLPNHFNKIPPIPNSLTFLQVNDDQLYQKPSQSQGRWCRFGLSWGKLEDKNEKFTRDSYIEGTEHFQQRTGLLTAPIKISAEMMNDENKIPIYVLNTTDKSIRVYREQTAATIQELPSTHNIEHISESNMGENSPSSQYDPVPEVSIGEQLTTQQRENLEVLIRKNTQVFDYPGNSGFTTTIEHTIPTAVSDPIVSPQTTQPGVNTKNE